MTPENPLDPFEISDPGTKRDLLSKTALNIQIAGNGGQSGFFAAHGNTDSVLALVTREGTTVWRVTSETHGTKAERKQLAQSIRQKFADEGLTTDH